MQTIGHLLKLRRAKTMLVAVSAAALLGWLFATTGGFNSLAQAATSPRGSANSTAQASTIANGTATPSARTSPRRINHARRRQRLRPRRCRRRSAMPPRR